MKYAIVKNPNDDYPSFTGEWGQLEFAHNWIEFDKNRLRRLKTKRLPTYLIIHAETANDLMDIFQNIESLAKLRRESI